MPEVFNATSVGVLQRVMENVREFQSAWRIVTLYILHIV